jgi:hypothetical protein
MPKPRSTSAPAVSENDVLWTSDNPRYGVVRRVLFCGVHAASFDDLNGDFREVCLTIFERRTTGWEEVYSQDDIGYPAHEDDSSIYGLSGGRQVWACGRARPHARARIELYGGDWTVDVDADGWWLLVADAPRKALKRILAAEADSWRSLMAKVAGTHYPGATAGGGLQVWSEGDAPAEIAHLHRSHLRVTVE